MPAINPLNVLAQCWEESIKCQTFRSNSSPVLSVPRIDGSVEAFMFTEWLLHTHSASGKRVRKSASRYLHRWACTTKQSLTLNLCIFEDSTRACMHGFVCLHFTCTYLKVGLDVFWHDMLGLGFVLAIYHVHVKSSLLWFVQTERGDWISSAE